MSGEQLFTNDALTTLGSALTSTATTLTVATGTGALFPSPSGVQFYLATLWTAGDATLTPNEIVQVTARSGDSFTIVRGQEGTTPQNWNVGDNVQLLVTAGTLATFAQQVDVQAQTGNSAVDTGTANAGAITLSPSVTAMSQLLYSPVRVKKIATANTGAYTLNINGLGSYAVTFAGSALLSGDLPASKLFDVSWDGAGFELLSPPATGRGGPPTGAAGGDLTGTYPSPIVGNSKITTAKMVANAATNAILAQMAANTLKGNATGSTANAQDLSISSVLGMLGLVTNYASPGYVNIFGFIVQWGTTAAIGINSSATVTLPITFPTAIFPPQLSMTGTTAGRAVAQEITASRTTSSFQVNVQEYSGGAAAQPVNWLVVGH